MSAFALKVVAFGLGIAFGGVAAADIPSLNQFDVLFAAAGTFLIGWSGFRRPGDAPVQK